MQNISQIEQLKDQLKQGDNKRIHEITGYTENYVSMVLTGKRPPNRKIIMVARQIIADREKSNQTITKKIKQL